MNRQTPLFIPVFLAVIASASFGQQYSITVMADKPGASIQPTMWGIFFEDINFAADGGIYAELVKNRSFEFADPLMGWKAIKTTDTRSRIQIINRESENPNNPRCARIISTSHEEIFGLSNDGFRGMGIKKDNHYRFSVVARKMDGEPVAVNIDLIDSNGVKIGGGSIVVNGTEWKKYEVIMTATGTEPKAKMNVLFSGNGTIEADMVSLFPLATWKSRENGLRADLVQLLADMKPGFIRFPGGCIVEGRDLHNRYQWKNTVGDIDGRKQIVNLWNYASRNTVASDYYQSYGLGFFEYFQLAEDIGAEPLPILNCGMACQFRANELVPLEDLGPYVQDALDLIEFANGSTATQWGKMRADMGHPAPFHLKYIGIGNEQWDVQYIERSNVFVKALREKHPEIKIVGTAGAASGGPLFEYQWNEHRKSNIDVVDEHYYQSPSWFFTNATRYDMYDRKGPKVFAGEYAAQSVKTGQPDNSNNWLCALSEAAFMTGLERNADVVAMASYAPLFAHVDAFQWKPDLIWFDNLRSAGTPSYYVQKLFSLFKGSYVVPVSLDGKPLTGQEGLYASSCLDSNNDEVILKIVNSTSAAKSCHISFEGAAIHSSNADIIIIADDNLNAFNTVDVPFLIHPIEEKAALHGRMLDLQLRAQSLTIARIKKK